MRRRRLLKALPPLVVAGCSAATGTRPPAPDPDRDPVTLLPPTPEGMERHHAESIPVGDSGAEAAAFVEFLADVGVRYYVELLRWPTAAAAVDGLRIYTDGDRAWQVFVANGVFSWAGTTVGGDESTLVEIMGRGEGLTPDFVRDADRIT